MLRPDVAVLHHAGDQGGVDQPADAKESEGEKEGNAGERSIQVESMSSEDADEEPKEVRDEHVFLAWEACEGGCMVCWNHLNRHLLNHRGVRERNLYRSRRRGVMVVVVDDIARMQVTRNDAVVKGRGRWASLHGCRFACIALNPPRPARSLGFRLQRHRFGRTVLQASNAFCSWRQTP